MRSLSLLGLILAGGAVPAQIQNPDTTPTILKAWQDFQAEHRGSWTTEWHPLTRTPKAIYGPGLNLGRAIFNAADAKAAAEGVLNRYQVMLGKRGSDFVLRSNGKANQTWFTIFRQQYKGIEVEGGRADCFIHESGVVSVFGATSVPVPFNFNITPAIPAAAARGIAERSLLGKASTNRQPAAPQLLVWTDLSLEQPGSVHLAWKVRVDEQPSELVAADVYVDAGTGKVLKSVNQVHYCVTCKTHRVRGSHRLHDAMHKRAMIVREAVGAAAPKSTAAALTGTVMAYVDLTSTATGALTNVPLANVLVRAATGGSAYTDSQGRFSIANAGTSAVQVSAFLEGRHQRRVQVYQGTQMVASQSITTGTPGTLQFGTAGAAQFDRSQMNVYYWQDDANEWVRKLIPAATSQLAYIDRITAYVNRNASCNATYGGLRTNFYHRSSTCNNTAFSAVILHEWGHGIDDAFGGISQTDGLSEGWGDIIAMYRLQDPIMGRGFRLNGGAVRSGLNSRTYPVNSTSVHAQGEVWMGFAWDLRTNLVNAKGTGPGHTTAEQIIIPSLLADATNQPAAVRAAFVVDDNDGNLNNGTPNYQYLSAAAKKRTLPFPELKLATIAHSPLNNSSEIMVPRVVRAVVAPTSGTISKVELSYIEGFNLVTREMVLSGTKANEYVGMLPGLPDKGQLAYFMTVTHSSSVLIRLPETGSYSYKMGTDDVIFGDNFDGATNGWVHATTGNTSNSQDDWQRNTPAGRSGSGWRDPSSAASGRFCWGNDMGQTINGQGWNGAYQGNVENFLRSPNFSTLGKTGLRLRFKRWLTVQSSQFDQAEIRINGTVVWSNPNTGNLVDTSWQTIDMAIPQADNRFSVYLEFRLRSNGSTHLGGWNVDDVEIYMPNNNPRTGPVFTVKPEIIDLGKTANAEISGAASAPALMLLSTGRGPLKVPGLPEIFVDANFVAGAISLDAQGKWSVQFTAPTSSAATGRLTYGQILQLSNSKVEGSNGVIVLFGK